MAARTGEQYLARLARHSPEVWVGDRRITDVTTDAAIGQPAREIARLYDLASRAENSDFAVFDSPSSGQPVSSQFLVPKSREDLVKRRQLHKLWADASYGMMGRTTDFMGSMLTAWNIYADFFGAYADNVRNYFEYVRENDLFLTHALIDPPVDRSKPPSEQPDDYTYLGVVKESDAGLVVRGAKMFATAAPYADEILVWPFATREPTERDARYAIAFAIPTDSPGLRFIARAPFGGGNLFDKPLASRFDEMDAVAVFDDVLVPWERVFINQDHELVKNIWKVNSNAFTGVQTAARLQSKLQFVAGLVRRATAAVQTDQFPQVRDSIGEITTYIELIRAALESSEYSAKAGPEGTLIPNTAPLFAIRNSGNRWYPRSREVLQEVLAGSLLYQPASVTALRSPVRPDIDKFYRGPEVDAEERIKLFSIASDLAIDAFGGRHELYERLYAGPPLFLRIATQYLQYDWTEPDQLVDELLGSFSAAEVLDGRPAPDQAGLVEADGDGRGVSPEVVAAERV